MSTDGSLTSTDSSLSTSGVSSTSATDDSTDAPSGLKSPTSSSPPVTPPTGPTQSPTNEIPPPVTNHSAGSSEPNHALKPPIPPQTRKVSGALLKASMSALSTEETAFPRLIHSLPLVLAEVNNGVDTVRKVGEFVEKIAKAKQAYAAACLQAVQEVSLQSSPVPTGHTLVPAAGSRPRSASNSGLAAATVAGKARSNSSAGISTDEQVGARFLSAWKTLRDVVHAEAISDIAGAKAYHETVAEPLLNYHKELVSKVAIVTDHADNMISQLRQSQERLLQNKIQVMKLVESEKVAEERERQEKEEKEKGSSGLAKAAKELKSIGFLFKSKDKQMTEAMSSLSSDELREQAYQAALMYQQSVDYANKRSAQYFDHDTPTILAQLQQMEVTRLETLRLHLESLSQHLSGLMTPADKRVASYASAVHAMSTKADIDDFVEMVSGGVGVSSTSRPNEYRYDLPFTADDVKANRVPDPRVHSVPTTLPNSYFGTSLEACMRLSQQQGKKTDVPFLVVELCDRIRRGGKPVFMAVVDLDDVLRVRSRLDAGESHIGGGGADDEAELAAAALKMWLRDLDPRLISGVHYDAAIGLAKAGEIKEADAIALYHSLPPLNQSVLHHIASTLASVSVGGTMDSVATTLAPHLLQAPPSSDPAAALADVNYQVKLIAVLLAAVANQAAPPAAFVAASLESSSSTSHNSEASTTSTGSGNTSVNETTQ